jgi:hypothetical protein
MYSQTCNPTTTTLGTPKMAVVDRWLLCIGVLMKITILFGVAGFRLTVVDR